MTRSIVFKIQNWNLLSHSKHCLQTDDNDWQQHNIICLQIWLTLIIEVFVDAVVDYHQIYQSVPHTVVLVVMTSLINNWKIKTSLSMISKFPLWSLHRILPMNIYYQATSLIWKMIIDFYGYLWDVIIIDFYGYLCDVIIIDFYRYLCDVIIIDFYRYLCDVIIIDFYRYLCMWCYIDFNRYLCDIIFMPLTSLTSIGIYVMLYWLL